jgi:AhpD family alkylhydroperoxidase
MMRTHARRFGVRESYDALLFGSRALLRTAVHAAGAEIDPRFAERLMLAVTEVNGCEVCSYAHTRMALRKGLTREEVESLLGASDAFVVPEEATGILFAQHYADSGGRPDREAYESLVREYGAAKSGAVIAAVQMMMAGNLVGLPLSAFLARLRGRPYPNSSLLHELGLPLVQLVLLPLAALHAFIGWIGGQESIRFRS